MSVDVRIKKKYEDFMLDVSFESDIKRIGILGASGSGKSLTLKSIAGLVRPDEGRISHNDMLLYDSDMRIDVKAGKRRVGYLFQDYALFPNMTVEENISAALHGMRHNNRHYKGSGNNTGRTADDILKRFDLFDIKEHRPHELSGGQQQRTALARMLATDPELLLLDEPFSAMDAHLREGMRLELISILDKCDKTVILVSHDRDEVYQMCDRLILLKKGRVIADGDTDELFRHPETVAAARLTGCKNISRIQKLTGHRVRALDWDDIELVTDEAIGDEITHIGIRAHDLVPDERSVNVISCGDVRVSRLPFEWYITLENGLWWKASRELYDEYNTEMIPRYVSIDPGKVLLLKDV